jgi:hypothetical protein
VAVRLRNVRRGDADEGRSVGTGDADRFGGRYLDSSGLYDLDGRTYDPSSGSYGEPRPVQAPTLTPLAPAYANVRPTVEPPA